MGNKLPPDHFHKAPTPDLEAAITDGAYRFLQWIRHHCWDGTPFVLPTRDETEAYFAQKMNISQRAIRNYSKQCTGAGLLEARFTSRGYELHPAGMVVAEASEPLPAMVGKNPSFRKKSAGKNIPKPQGQEGGDSLYTSLPPISNISKVAENFDRNDGKYFPKVRKIFSQTRPEFGKNIPTSALSTTPVENPVDKSNLTPAERDYVERLEAVNLYGNNILRAVRKAITQGISADELLSLAQTLLETLKAERGIENIYRTAAWRLANNRLVLPTERDRRREQHDAAKRRQREDLLAEVRASTG